MNLKYINNIGLYGSGYEVWKPRSTKNAVGYRIEISGDNVKCFPVLKESEAVIVIKVS